MVPLKTVLVALILSISVSVANGRSPPVFTPPPLPPLPPPTCYKKIDLAFVIDSSTSISRADFTRQKDFVIDIVDLLDIGDDKTRVAAVTFSNYVFPKFFLNTFTTKQDIKDALGAIPFTTTGDATRTYKGLEYTYNKIFQTSNGDRKDVMDVVVVLTDGETNPGSYDSLTSTLGQQQTLKEAAKLKQKPTTIFAIGVGGRTNTEELNGISSDPDTKYTIQVPTFADLNKENIKEMIINRTCGSNQNIQPECTETVADVFFVLDESASISTDKNFQKEINFTISVVEELNVGPGKSQVGAITFGSEANVRFNLNEAQTRNEVAERLLKIKWGAGQSTELDQALKLLRTQGLNQMYGSRPDVPQIAVVITDGVSTHPEKTKEELKRLHQEDYILFVIGVGPELNEDELNLIAKDPNHVFRVDSNDALPTIKESLAIRLCNQGISVEDLRKLSIIPKMRYLY